MMVKQLRPFIVTSWHGHRDDPDLPAAVRSVWSRKFNRQTRQPLERSGVRGRGRNAGRPPSQSNVDLAVLDASGRVVYAFDGFHRQRTARRESRAEYTGRELRKGVALLGKKRLSYKPHALVLPDLDASAGIRVFVRLEDDRMPAYNAPVVEVVSLDADD